jgi:hypothetical protein
MKVVRLPDHPTFFEVLERKDLYALLRNRDTQEEFVVSERTFRSFIPVTHPCIRKEL